MGICNLHKTTTSPLPIPRLEGTPLDEIVITPTTKGVIDVPITRDEIVEKGYLSRAQTDFIFKKATELFKYGAKVARERGLILVDTKYEFGFSNNEIILMDELHTCDSSRYWKADSYDELVSQGKEPEKFDKDCIRDSRATPFDGL